MEKNNSFLSQKSPQVGPYVAYTKDFENDAGFIESNDGEKIVLELPTDGGDNILGIFDGNQWQRSKRQETDTYLVDVEYYNKKRVWVKFDCIALNSKGEPAIAFLRKAAKKFWLQNELLAPSTEYDDYYKKAWIKKPESNASWSEIVSFLKNIKENCRTIFKEEPKISTGESWSKTMTLEEAKELFQFLKVDISLPE